MDAKDLGVKKFLAPLGVFQGYRTWLSTNIWVYIHPDEFAGYTPEVQGAMRERARSRISDHLRRRILNAPANVAIPLASQENNPDGDILEECFVEEVSKMMVPKMFGEVVEVVSAHLKHTGWIA